MKLSFKNLIFSAVLFCSLLTSSTTLFAAESRDVNNFNEFKNALMDSNVTEINVNSSLSFTGNIWGIPNRDLKINGNADRGVVINSKEWSIYGQQNKSGKNTLSIENAKIVGRGTPTVDAYTDGRFFTGGQENGPNAYGWDVYARDVNYVGARFVHLSNGTLTFDGYNEIYTNCENAWVNHVVFKAGSTYKSSNSGTGDYGAFYFNKGKGIADGTATIENGAQTYFNIGTAVQPVFTGDVYKTTIESNAIFDVNTIGHGIWYVAGHPSYYKMGNPEFNVLDGAEVNIKQVDYTNVLNSRRKTNPNPNLYVPVYYAKSVINDAEVPGSLNIYPGAKFYVSGKTLNKSKSGVISVGHGSTINITNPEDFDIKNLAINSNAIAANNSLQKFNININSDINSWNKTTTGSYDDNNPTNSFSNVNGTVELKGNKTISNFTDNNAFNNTHNFEYYGRIALRGGVQAKEYKVTFDSQGGTEVSPSEVIVPEGETVAKPIDPTKDGFEFVGWYKEPTGATEWDFANDIVNEDITLYAKWKEVEVAEELVFTSDEIVFTDKSTRGTSARIGFGYSIVLPDGTEIYNDDKLVCELIPINDNSYFVTHDKNGNRENNSFYKNVLPGEETKFKIKFTFHDKSETAYKGATIKLTSYYYAIQRANDANGNKVSSPDDEMWYSDLFVSNNVDNYRVEAPNTYIFKSDFPAEDPGDTGRVFTSKQSKALNILLDWN